MNLKKQTLFYLITFLALLYSCKKDLYNVVSDSTQNKNEILTIDNLKASFYQKHYDVKLNQNLNDSLNLQWQADWMSYTTANLGDSITYYYVILNPTIYNSKTKTTNTLSKEVNIKKLLLIGKKGDAVFYRIATYFYENPTLGTSKTIRSIGHNYSFKNFTGRVLYENLDKGSFNQRYYSNGNIIQDPNVKVVDALKNNSLKPNYWLTECYNVYTCSYYGICDGYPYFTAVGGRDVCPGPPTFRPTDCYLFQGWYYSNSTYYQVCNDYEYPDPPTPPTNPGGGGGGGGTPPQNNIPCPGDPVTVSTIAKSSPTNINGGRFGPTRTYNGKPKNHYGTDVYAEPNTPLYPILSGAVVRIVNNIPEGIAGYGATSFGNLIEVESTLASGEKIRILYGHLHSVNSNLQVGSSVNIGSPMALTGRTGNAFKGYTPHVHVQASISGTKINAEPYIRTKFTTNGTPIITPC